MRTGIIAVLCMALSAQALAWTAMPCCDDADAEASVNHDMTADMQSHDTGCAKNMDDQGTANKCCPGAFCNGASAAFALSVALVAPGVSADLFTVIGALPSTTAEQLLRPPIA